MALSNRYVQGQKISREVISSSGNHHENSTTQLSWTLGELIIETRCIGSTLLCQGFQQPDYEVINLAVNTELYPGISIYPVPTTDFVTIESENHKECLEISLYNLNGELILVQSLNPGSIKLDLNSLPSSEYILNVSDTEKQLGSYKIIKH